MRSFLTFMLLILLGCGAQKKQKIFSSFNQQDLIKIAELKYGFDLEKYEFCDLYIFNGVLNDRVEIDSVLSNYDKSEIGFILTFEPGEDQTWFNKKCDLITIIRTKEQNDKEKREILNQVRKIYTERVSKLIITDYQCSECPVMSVNYNLIINPYERKRIVNEISLQEIEYIVYIKQPLNTETYGKPGMNGIVEITLK